MNGQVESAVSSCWTGRVYSTSNGKTNETFKKNCPPGANDACAVSLFLIWNFN